jgi:transcriptional regulator with XRE-family HTH domain
MPDENTLKKLGTRIKAARKECRLTQETLAARLDVSAITVSRWETGKQSPDYFTLCEMAELLNVPISLLTDQSDGDAGSDDFIVIFSRHTKRKSNLGAIFENFLRDVGRLNPDALVKIHETQQAWDSLADSEKQTLADGLSFVFGSFYATVSNKGVSQGESDRPSPKARKTTEKGR